MRFGGGGALRDGGSATLGTGRGGGGAAFGMRGGISQPPGMSSAAAVPPTKTDRTNANETAGVRNPRIITTVNWFDEIRPSLNKRDAIG